MNKKVIIPPIKTQGIKSKLVPWIAEFVDAHRVSTDLRWIEPFFGSGVVGFNIGSQFSSQSISDKNPHIIQFYEMIRCGIITPETARERLEAYSIELKERGVDFYKDVRTSFNELHADLDFLFLSRCCFNGLMRFNSKGQFNVPFCKKPERLSKAYITKIINQIAAVQNVISHGTWEFSARDFKSAIADADENSIIYCDPPYYGRSVDYYGGWTEDDERSLFELLSATPAKFILSTWHHNDYRENEMIQRYWNNFNVTTTEHTYQVGAHEENRKHVVEALVSNF